jgi:hypothetical protein
LARQLAAWREKNKRLVDFSRNTRKNVANVARIFQNWINCEILPSR